MTHPDMRSVLYSLHSIMEILADLGVVDLYHLDRWYDEAYYKMVDSFWP